MNEFAFYFFIFKKFFEFFLSTFYAQLMNKNKFQLIALSTYN